MCEMCEALVFIKRGFQQCHDAWREIAAIRGAIEQALDRCAPTRPGNGQGLDRFRNRGRVSGAAALVGIKTAALDAIDAWSQRPPIAPPHWEPLAGCATRIRGRSLDDLVRHASR
jgi:hypothetical protein